MGRNSRLDLDEETKYYKSEDTFERYMYRNYGCRITDEERYRSLQQFYSRSDARFRAAFEICRNMTFEKEEIWISNWLKWAD